MEHFHAALHKTDVPTFQEWALGLWCQARQIHNDIEYPLNMLTDQPAYTGLLEKLGITGEVQDYLYQGIECLPPDAIGDWCSGEPIHTKESDNARASYTTPYLHFSRSVWEALAKLDNDTINLWLSPRTGRKLDANPLDYWQKDSLAIQKIIGTLVKGCKVFHAHEHWECSALRTPLTLLDNDYERLYLFTSAITGNALASLQTSDNEQIICLIFSDLLYSETGYRPTPRLPNLTCLYLPEAMRVTLALASYQEQIALLNRHAAAQLGIPPDKIFRTVGGMTDRGIQHHFFGRRAEIKQLTNMVKTGDQGFVIIGGRRMGKTSLRQYFEHHLAKNYPLHPCISINCETVSHYKGLLLEEWFINQLAAPLKRQNKLNATIWFNRRQTEEVTLAQVTYARNVIEQCLRACGKSPAVLIIDETEHLVRQDKDSNFRILHWIRGLVTEKLLHLVITSYPHGKQLQYAIPTLLYTPKTPLYNLVKPMPLPSWSPVETWEFIHSKLQLLGINLPLDMRLQALGLTQGVPWIANYLGQKICEHTKRGLVTDAHWKWIHEQTLGEIAKTLRQTVNNIAETYDSTHGCFDKATHSGTMQRNLWPALRAVAKNRKIPKLAATDTDWPAEAEFTEDDVLPHFQASQVSVELDDLRNTLAQFTDTGLLKGFPTDVHRFAFANNLFPMIVATEEKN